MAVDIDMVDDLCEILGHIHVPVSDGSIRNPIHEVIIHGHELFKGTEVAFSKIESTHMEIDEDGHQHWSFVGRLMNGCVGWIRVSKVSDEREYHIRLWVSKTYPAWYPTQKTMS